MPHYLKPHSEEWFKALARSDRQQAEHTRQILRLAGKNDVCSVCGDEQAPEYEILKASFPEDSVATIRLCGDCREIRQAMHDEDFISYQADAGPDRRN